MPGELCEKEIQTERDISIVHQIMRHVSET